MKVMMSAIEYACWYQIPRVYIRDNTLSSDQSEYIKSPTAIFARGHTSQNLCDYY
jgi:hypothetical protein